MTEVHPTSVSPTSPPAHKMCWRLGCSLPEPYECRECGRTFSQSSSLIVHYRFHTGEKPYKCNRCGRAFSQSSSLTQHYRHHSGEKPYKCNECGRAFAHTASLIKHQKSHAGKKNPTNSNAIQSKQVTSKDQKKQRLYVHYTAFILH